MATVRVDGIAQEVDLKEKKCQDGRPRNPTMTNKEEHMKMVKKVSEVDKNHEGVRAQGKG